MRHEEYMRMREELEQAGKEAYGNVDMVNSPPHYIEKAQWYLEKLIEEITDE
jgi:hypothetical protein